MDAESAWAIKPGATVWADEVEAEEVKKAAAVDEEAFPTLGAASSNEPKKGKAAKKKGTKMDLNAFLNAPASRKTAVSDAEILMQLPKGSSGLSRDDPSALGGGFRDYGGDRQGACYCHIESTEQLKQIADVLRLCIMLVTHKCFLLSTLRYAGYSPPTSKMTRCSLRS